MSRCDGCGAEAPRVFLHPAPAGWLYLEATDDESGEVTIVYACTETCARGQWKPGPRWTAAEMGIEGLGPPPA